MAITKVSTAVVDMSGNTGGLVIAKGNDSERPLPANIGMIRENTETTPSKLEVYNSNGWTFFKDEVALTVDFLVVAGGGGGTGGYGNGNGAGAGGAGGLITTSTYGGT